MGTELAGDDVPDAALTSVSPPTEGGEPVAGDNDAVTAIGGVGVMALGRDRGRIAPTEPGEAPDHAGAAQTAIMTNWEFQEHQAAPTEALAAEDSDAAGPSETRVALSAAPPDDAHAESEAEKPPGRLSKPMIAAAVMIGAVLVAAPFVVSSLTSHKGNGPANDPQSAAQWKNNVALPSGFVPTAESLSTALGGASPSGQPAQPVNGAIPAAGAAGAAAAAGGARAAGGAPAAAGGAGAAQPQGNPQPGAPAQAPAGPVFTGIGGYHCTGSGQYRTTGYYVSGNTGFVKHSSGSYAGDGCDGSYESLPMSGNASQDGGNSAVWSFAVGSVKSCQVWVYIPSDSNIQNVGGSPAYYTVHASSSPASSNQIGSFDINQVGDLGQWVSAGSFGVSSGELTVDMHDRGQDWVGSTKTNAHLAAGAVKTACYA